MKTKTQSKNRSHQKSLTSIVGLKAEKVKKLLYGVLVVHMLLLSQTAIAQIKLEYTFDEAVSWSGKIYMESDMFPENTYNITKIVENSYVVKIYNADYSLSANNTYQFTPPVGYKVSSVGMSRKLFNTDNNYEFLVTYERLSYIQGDDARIQIILYNQNGGMIKDFGFGYSLYAFPYLQVANNQLRLEVRKYFNGGNTIKTEIYSVPGAPPTGTPGGKVNVSQPPYPNPASAVITLPYKLEQGEISVMNIYNMSGQLIDTKLIDAVFDKILLNVSDYAKGMYIYEVNGVSSRFVVE